MFFHGRSVFSVIRGELHRSVNFNAYCEIVHAVAGDRKPRAIFTEVLSVDFEAPLLNVDLHGLQLVRNKKLFQILTSSHSFSLPLSVAASSMPVARPAA